MRPSKLESDDLLKYIFCYVTTTGSITSMPPLRVNSLIISTVNYVEIISYMHRKGLESASLPSTYSKKKHCLKIDTLRVSISQLIRDGSFACL